MQHLRPLLRPVNERRSTLRIPTGWGNAEPSFREVRYTRHFVCACVSVCSAPGGRNTEKKKRRETDRNLGVTNYNANTLVPLVLRVIHPMVINATATRCRSPILFTSTRNTTVPDPIGLSLPSVAHPLASFIPFPILTLYSNRPNPFLHTS